ncbi:MAG: phosphate ABC transporter permease [Candidatus Aegiribacteria sp. MLS_C]|nr:MAG: phosphate ABC transporter permease [Candidatus Aegiribacteria sp. MLS_C]
MKLRTVKQHMAFSAMWVACGLTLAILLVVIGYVMIKGFALINLDFFLTSPRGGLSGEGGIASTIIATVYLVITTLVFATPLGVGAGIFLVEYADSISSRFVKKLVASARFGVETLAGVPSIIFGLFGYALFVTALHFGFSILSAALAGTCLVIPVIIRTTEEALKAVPMSYREASLAIGAGKWETVWKVVLPSAVRGISTGIVLSAGRIVSETAIFYVTLGGSYRTPTSLMSSGRTMALHVYYLAMETRAFDKALATAAVLVVLIILLNLVINTVSRWLSR